MFYFARLMFALLLLSGSLWAFTTRDHVSWIKPSYIDAVWQKNGETSYMLLEELQRTPASLIDSTTQSTGRYGGALAITVREYVQPSGLPGFNFMHIYTSEGEARFNNGVVGYTYRANFRQQIFNVGTGTDELGDYYRWLIEFRDLSGKTKIIHVDSCFSYSYGTGEHCKTRNVKIYGFN